MQLINQIIPDDANIFLVGDDHEGTSLRHDAGWHEFVEMVNAPYDGLDAEHNFIVEHGDVIDAIHPDDPRYDGLTNKDTILEQINTAVNHRLHTALKTIVILDGNHPMKLWKYGRITQELCNRIHVPFGTYDSIISYLPKKGAKPFLKHFASHGFGSMKSTIDEPEDRENSLKRTLRKKLQHKAGDCHLMSMGHTHKLLIKEPRQELYITSVRSKRVRQAYTTPMDVDTSGKTYIDPFMRWYVNTGSFYRLYGDGVSGYAELAGYDPIELGFAICKIRGRKIVGIDKIVL